MKNLRALLFVVACGVTLFFPSQSDAKIGDRIKARRAAKKSTVCIGPDCVQPPIGTDGPSQLRINRKGGFKGQLADDEFAKYFAKQTAPTPAEVLEPPAEKGVEVSIVVEAVDPVVSTQQAVEEAEAALADARAAHERAIVEQQQADAREALELQQEIDDLTAQLEALQPDQD